MVNLSCYTSCGFRNVKVKSVKRREKESRKEICLEKIESEKAIIEGGYKFYSKTYLERSIFAGHQIKRKVINC